MAEVSWFMLFENGKGEECIINTLSIVVDVFAGINIDTPLMCPRERDK